MNVLLRRSAQSIRPVGSATEAGPGAGHIVDSDVNTRLQGFSGGGSVRSVPGQSVALAVYSRLTDLNKDICLRKLTRQRSRTL